jgi:hypothetical protein
MKFRYIKMLALAITGIVLASSCKKFLDINKDPDRIPSNNPPLAQLLTSAQMNLAFEGGSDLYRYSTLIAQQMSGQASSPNQTYEYDRYNIAGSDMNNVWGSIFATTLSDLELIIKYATAGGSPHYAGVAKILKAYEYSLVVDTWGKVPYSEAQQLDALTSPHYDDDATIYPKLITLLNDAITDLGQTTSNLSPGTNSIMFTNSNFTTAKAQWIKLANTLKLRLFLHYSKKDAAFSKAQMDALINSSATFMTSSADNFQMIFNDAANQRNPITQFEVSRANYLFANATMVNLMNTKNDPRRPFYFTAFPFTSSPATYKGVTPGDPATINYSRVHTYLRGTATGSPVQQSGGGILASAYTYSGTAPLRMVTYPEYCFIRAEAGLMGVANSDAQTWYTNGITASMQQAGVSAANITTYLAAYGTLAGTNAQKLQQIIEEKYVALFGVSVEPWSDWRRTGYPSLTPPSNRVAQVTNVPRSLFYPQSEIDLNPNAPGQKSVDLQTKVFWDN